MVKNTVRLRYAVDKIEEAYAEDMVEYGCTITELFKIWGYDNQDLKEEFISILRENHMTVDDDCNIEDCNGDVTFEELRKGVLYHRFI